MPHLLGVDIGTSGTKVLLLSESGKVLDTQTQPHTLLTPKPGWSEQDPQEWWQATCKAVNTLVRRAKIKKGDLAGIGLSGQMHGSVFLDEKGRILRPALLWNDQRTAEQSALILEKAGGPKKMLELTGNLPLTGYTAPKLLWLRQTDIKKYNRLHKVVLPKDYVRFRMTGVYSTDVTDASGTALFDVRARKWSDELLKKLDIKPEILPDVHESTAVAGTLHADAAKSLSLEEGLPVIAGAGDVMAGAVGNGVVEKGLVNANLGTGGVMCAHSDTYRLDPDGRLATMCHAVPGAHVVYGCMLSAAGSLQWYADELAGEEQAQAKKAKKDVFDLLLAIADKAPVGSDGLFFLPYLTGERCPHPDPDARGGWIGLTRRHTKAHIVRSLVEGVTHGMTDMLGIMRDEMKVPVKQIRATGGGAKNTLWRQVQADLYNAPLALTNSEEGSAFGAALLAAVGCGMFKSVPDACKKLIKPTQTVRARKKQVEIYARHHALYAKLYTDLKDRYTEIAALAE
jgi:xylulokinase